MPFTPTHIAAVLPVPLLTKHRLPMSALVIGSMIPDLPLFLPSVITFDYRLTHTIAGVFSGCLPLGICLFLWFQCFAKRPLAMLLPTWIRARIGPYERPYLKASPGFMLGVGAATVVGAATHLFWDSFTHHNRWGYRQLPSLHEDVYIYGNFSLELHELLQHGSTIVFLPVIIATLIFWLRRQQPTPVVGEQLSVWEKVCWQASLLALPNICGLVWSLHRFSQLGSVGQFAREGVTTAGLVLFLVVNVFAAYVQLAKPAVSLARQATLGPAR